MESVSDANVDVFLIYKTMADNNEECNRKRKATIDTATNKNSANFTVSQQRRNEFARSNRHGYDLPNVTWRPLPV